MQYLLLIIGFVLLIKGADFFVDGSSSTAKRLKVPSLIIGMTVVAMGTSLPECAVSTTASATQKNELAIANIVGSNIFNLVAICGLCALLCPLVINKSTLIKEFPFSIFLAGLLLCFGLTGSSISRIEAIIFLLIFAAFIFSMIRSAQKNRTHANEEKYQLLPVWKCILFIVFGIAAIAVGGEMVVKSASRIARSFGMSDNLIGLTIVALGTSLPELVTSIVAAKKNEMDMALGNVIGSNIFNILFVLGIAASISPIAFITENVIDIILLIAMSIMVWLMCWKRKKLIRPHGVIMLLVYTGYVIYICNR